MVKKDKEVKVVEEVKKVLKYKVVQVSDYYQQAKEIESGNVRDVALALLLTEYDGKEIRQVDDRKAGVVKFAVKI